MSLHVYNSQSFDYFDRLGKYCLASVLARLPLDTKITVTTEDIEKWPILSPRINLVDLYSLDNGFTQFQDRWHNRTSGKVINFAKKGYTILNAVENFQEDLLLHLDADAFVRTPLTHEYFSKLVSNNLAAHLEIQNPGDEFVVESGFFVMNRNHPGIKDFARIYRDIYDNDRNDGMGKYYDGNVHGATVTQLKQLGYMFNNLNLRKKGNTPMRGSVVDTTVGHFKGKVKLSAEQHYKELGIDKYLSEVYA
jgi:hypothetical protein